MSVTLHHAEAQRRFRGGDLHGARALFRAALDEDPGHPASHHDLGFLLRQLGDRSGADHHVRASLALAPDLAVGWTTVGLLAGDAGAFAPARRSIRRARLIAPAEPSSLIALAELAEDDECRAFADRLAAALRAPEVPPTTRARLLHARGRLLERAGDADGAFEAVTAAHALRRPGRPYDRAEDSAFFAAISATCDAAWWRRPGNRNDPGIRPIFIVGMPRSGTTLLEQMLSRHPGIAAGGETLALHTVLLADLPQRLGRAFPDCLAAAGPDDWAWAAGRYRTATAARVGGAVVFTDKLPANFLLVGPILKMFPEARILHSVRDPLDTCVSCYFTDFAHGQSFAGELGDLGHHHRLYRSLMRHWRALADAPLFEARLLDVGHEALVADPEPVLRRVVERCGLGWDPACLDFAAAAHPANTAAWQRVRAPLDGSRGGRWRRYQHRLGRLAGGLAGAPADATRRALAWEPGLRAECAALARVALDGGDLVAARRRIARLRPLLAGAPQALARAAALAERAEDWGLMRRLLSAAAGAAPGVAAIHTNLAVAHGREGDAGSAATALRRALALWPQAPEAWSNLGNFLTASDLAAAAAAHDRATRIVPADPGLHANRGLALMRTAGGARRAEQALRRALALEPAGLGHGLTLCHLAGSAGDTAAALTLLDRLACAHPGDQEVQYERGCALRDAGRDAEAITALRRAVVLAPELTALRHVLDALTGRPSRAAPVDYVRDLFDEYADRFDQHLTERLRYRTPAALAEAVARARPGLAGFGRALDLGCGTGLMGAALRERFAVGHLTGVDISGGMLARLQQKGGYDATAEADIEGYLERSEERYDLILAADVLVYFGALERFLAGAAQALADGGTLAISVERGGEQPFALGRQGRYAHRRDYVEAAAAAVRLRVLLCEEAAIRDEGREPVIGLLLVLAA